jgi:acyl-coenzyme A thioesterase PaaI-like protein
LSDAPARLPDVVREDPDHPGLYSWGDFPRGSFAAQTGLLLFMPDGKGRAMTRMFPTEAHQNMGGSILGGAVMSFIDMSLFAGGRCAGMAEGHYVTLDCHTRFVARGLVGVPLDGHVRLL